MFAICYDDGNEPRRAFYATEDEALAQAAADVAGGRSVKGIFPGTDEASLAETPTHDAAQVQDAAAAAVERLERAEAEVAEARAAIGF